MTLFVDRALAFLADGPGSGARVWELRGALPVGAAGPGRVVVDGGARFESESRADVRWIVGAGPGALRGIGTLDGDAPGWDEAVGWLAAELRARAAEAPAATARFAEAAAVPAERVRAKLYGRVRAWRASGDVPRAEVAWGARLDAAPAGIAPATMSAADTLMSAADKTLTMSRNEAAELSGPPAGPLPTGAPLAAGYRGPVVLSAPAAAWFVHEMGHAGLEWLGERPETPTGLTIEDDPTVAAWPCGFAWDDAGRAAGRAVLWGEGAAPERIARRSGSIRDAAVPSLSATRLIATARAAPPFDPGPGVPWIETVRAARFDPPSRTVLLRFETYFSRSSDDKWFVHPHAGTLVVGVEEAWSGVRRGPGSPALATDFARCTRQGVVIAVMVGAPTLVLDPVHIRLR